ncbi:hypothetical protein DICPUDRAFT_42915 [Dictyostelium purpureum]|uniref:Uncharacterized protein n=1 Tax=Dictyostelium purpureum TaxID=5786 RepID=F1A336_DICPU|nr:uncharacterized protein DICPUDRAFT_42915 [Dictyostelium purpureum]EGC29392.1 hypothetical protein DICPUDRAFT_42915 [Dictyostelium purpureum]|eukprot:XP_003294079.1 hypothetical protein DICPUDRAFT_42915 [Dictyostelium purpureum]
MTPYLKLLKGSYTLLSFFYFLANTLIRTFQSFPVSHKIILVTLYYTIFLVCIAKIFFGSPLRLIQSYILGKYSN